MLDQKPDKTFVRSERRAMNADRDLVDVVAVFVANTKSARLGEIVLVGRDGVLTTDRPPRLHVNLWSIHRRLIRYFDILDTGLFQHISRHYFGLFPKLRFIDKLLAELGWVVC